MSLVLTDRIDVDNMTVSDLVALGRYPYTSWNGSLSPEDKEVVADAMRRVNIFHQKDKPLNCISDGEKQRAVIAKALAQDTPLVLLDEPTSHLDLSSRIDIMFLLRDLSHTTKKTFVLSTHELDLAIGMADYIWLMQQNDGYPRRPFTRRHVSAIACKRQFRLRYRRRSLPNHTTARHTERRNSR